MLDSPPGFFPGRRHGEIEKKLFAAVVECNCTATRKKIGGQFINWGQEPVYAHTYAMTSS